MTKDTQHLCACDTKTKRELLDLTQYMQGSLENVLKRLLPESEHSYQILKGGDVDGNDYEVPLPLAKEGFWLTVGRASIHIKHGDDGVSVSVYAKDGEMESSLGETWVTHGELEGEDT